MSQAGTEVFRLLTTQRHFISPRVARGMVRHARRRMSYPSTAHAEFMRYVVVPSDT